VGTDITDVSVENLRKEFHSETFYQLDIGELSQSSPVWDEKYDVASCFDVLYHIVDDERYETAIKNIYQMLRPSGFLILSDNFVHRTPVRGTNQVSRSLYQIEDIMKRTGFQIISRKPLFFLMNYPVDSDSNVKKKLWKMAVLPATKSEAYGYVIGSILYPVELTMLNLFKESPTTEVMVCRRQ
jgi:SAM-dependent methyltransferase